MYIYKIECQFDEHRFTFVSISWSILSLLLRAYENQKSESLKENEKLYALL